VLATVARAEENAHPRSLPAMALYLVTGGAGFIGSHLVEALVARGDRARVLDDHSTSGGWGNLAGFDTGDEGSGAAVELVEGSVTDAPLVRRAAEGVHGAFHEAAQVSVPLSVEKPARSLEVNVGGTINVLEALREVGGRVVFAASSAAYGDGEELPKREDLPVRPLSPYAVGKVAGEQLLSAYAKLHGMHTTALRYFNVYGPRQADDSPYTGVIAIFARRLLAGESITIHGDGQQSRDFTFVTDVVRANLMAGRVYNVGAGGRISVERLYRDLADLVGVSAEPTFGPDRAGDVKHSCAAVDRIRADLGYEAEVPFEEGLRTTFEWYRERFAAR
jgi:UDP-glucose 4-epimerase